MANQKRTLAIIGGGAAGLVAAIAAGERARALGDAIDIVLYEGDERVGRSILATGNGRCNFSNAYIDAREYRNAPFVAEAFNALAAKAGSDYVHEFFESLGLAWREEADGRQYPLANKASVVVDVLRAAVGDVGVKVMCDAQVSSIDPPREAGKPFTMRMHDGKFERADAVIVACGGRAMSSLETFNIPRAQTHPVLGPLKVAPDDIPFTRELDNIRVKCMVTLARKEGVFYSRVMTEAGELMFRKYGVSGICVFNISRYVCPGDVLRIDFLGMGGGEPAEALLQKRRELLAGRYGEPVTYEMLLRGLMLPRVSEAVLKRAEIDPQSEFHHFDAAHFARLLSAFPLEVEGIGDVGVCQVHRGGFEVGAFNAATMQARDVPGFFAVGEALDVDGPCGGYNLHWAWTSGLLAGWGAIDQLADPRREVR